MIKLSIPSDKIPRSTTREQWREMDRWRRQVARVMQQHEPEIQRRTTAALADLVMFGTSHYVINQEEQP